MRHFNLQKKNYRKACIDQCIIQRCNNKLSIVKNQSKLKNLKRKKLRTILMTQPLLKIDAILSTI